MKSLSPSIRTIAIAAGLLPAACGLLSCPHIDNHRLPVGYVNLTFRTQAEWDIFGVSGAGQHKEFIIQERIPANFPYPATAGTGLGGILLCTTYATMPVAYDLACPVECKASVRVFINEDNEAECPQCHSRYDVFEKLGYPIYGKAAEEGFGLQVYSVGPGPQGEYMRVSL